MKQWITLRIANNNNGVANERNPNRNSRLLISERVRQSNGISNNQSARDNFISNRKWYKHIIEATIEARKKAKLTQQQLSELCGIIQSSIAKIKN